MKVHELQNNLIRNILTVTDHAVLEKMTLFFKEITNRPNGGKASDSEYLEPKGMDFEQWMNQFDDKDKWDEVIPEHGMTLREFRKRIWEAEQSEELTYEEYLEKTKHWFT